MEETVTISKKEYERLQKDSMFLECLRAQGVDNWDPGYSDAWREFAELEKQDGTKS